MKKRNLAISIRALIILVVTVLSLTVHVAAATTTLFSGGFTDNLGNSQWASRYGTFADDVVNIKIKEVPLQPDLHYAEAQRLGVIGVDFIYSADVKISALVDAHLQFRISDEGRYGIRLRPDGIVFYRFRREDRPCDSNNPLTIAHCPEWTSRRELEEWIKLDFPKWLELRSASLSLDPGSIHKLEIRARGPVFDVLLDGRLIFGKPIEDDSFAVGRFGVYVWGAAANLSQVVFSDVRATTEPTRLSNFALLYSTVGYEAVGTKRALVRTLNDLPAELFDATGSRFMLTNSNGIRATDGPLRALSDATGNPSSVAKTFGMQLWEADFSSITAEGKYTLTVYFKTSEGMLTLESAPFEIRSKLVTTRMLKPLSILNAEMRRAADEDFWRNWIKHSGDWSVAVDGAFLVDRANAQEGALLSRVFDRINNPLNMQDFRYVGRITIISGCDAQMQFRVTPTQRLAVTLQAGAGGGCHFGAGPGAVRIHGEFNGNFRPIAATLFPEEHPFQAGRPYDIDILAQGDWVTVKVDGVQLLRASVPNYAGGFALKAWASTVRFENVQAWAADVHLDRSPDGTWIPIHNDKPCYDVANPPETACNPFFSQLNGFHDCNNIIGEATSHGVFLAGLMEVWSTRAHTFSQDDREALRRAIITTALYIEELYQLRNGSGEFAHTEMGNLAIYTNLGSHQSEFALYGLSAFADKGEFVDRRLARQACQRSIQGAQWFWAFGENSNPITESIVYTHIARCAEREKFCSGDTCRGYWAKAFAAVEEVLSSLSTPRDMQNAFRDTGREVPWFEGTYEVFKSFPDKRGGYTQRLNTIVELLTTHLTKTHFCNENLKPSPICPANGFFVLPQASGTDPALPRANWVRMERVPLVQRSAGLPFLNFYEGNHFAVATSDAVYLALMTPSPVRARVRRGRSDLERIATGNFYWTLGLNPGIPASKVVNRSGSNTPWQAASFVYNGTTAFGRTMEGHRTLASSAKGWVAPWELSAASPHREVWWFDPQNRSVTPPNRTFQTIVNGHVIWDRQWDYWSSGEHGWSSGETFLRNDGTFLKAAMLLEDWVYGTTQHSANPYDTTRQQFFDTSHVDRAGTGWGFDDPNNTAAASASRAANDFCNGKGYRGGRFTGHHIGERLGVLCVSTSARFFDATDQEVRATGWGFDDINLASWALVARASTGFCNARGFIGGFFTGHQLEGHRGVICLTVNEATDREFFDSYEAFGDINSVPWAQAARAATNTCLMKGFPGGFFTGHQNGGTRELVCFVQ